ncbi:hypothetical protein GBA52_013409, partial [Prunus armeniaca]
MGLILYIGQPAVEAFIAGVRYWPVNIACSGVYQCCLNIGNEDFLKLAVEDFNICQSIHHKELNHLARWDVNVNVDCCSEHVEIIFSALKNTINELGVKAFTRQGRSVTSDIIETWLDLLKSGLKEAEWLRNKSVPTMEEYMTNGYISIGIGPIVLPALYFVGHELSEEVLYRLMSTCGSLLNDIQGFKRDSAEGK